MCKMGIAIPIGAAWIIRIAIEEPRISVDMVRDGDDYAQFF